MTALPRGKEAVAALRKLMTSSRSDRTRMNRLAVRVTIDAPEARLWWDDIWWSAKQREDRPGMLLALDMMAEWFEDRDVVL